MSTYAILKYGGKMYRVEKQPFESNEQVMDRAWYIAKKMETEKTLTYESACSESLKWLYSKYLKVAY